MFYIEKPLIHHTYQPIYNSRCCFSTVKHRARGLETQREVGARFACLSVSDVEEKEEWERQRGGNRSETWLEQHCRIAGHGGRDPRARWTISRWLSRDPISGELPLFAATAMRCPPSPSSPSGLAYDSYNCLPSYTMDEGNFHVWRSWWGHARCMCNTWRAQLILHMQISRK